MPISWLVGFIFGIGLATSGMWRRTKIKNFLTLYEDWDPSLMLVMCGAVGINLITFPLIIHKMKKPVWAKENRTSQKEISWFETDIRSRNIWTRMGTWKHMTRTRNDWFLFSYTLNSLACLSCNWTIRMGFSWKVNC